MLEAGEAGYAGEEDGAAKLSFLQAEVVSRISKMIQSRCAPTRFWPYLLLLYTGVWEQLYTRRVGVMCQRQVVEARRLEGQAEGQAEKQALVKVAAARGQARKKRSRRSE